MTTSQAPAPSASGPGALEPQLSGNLGVGPVVLMVVAAAAPLTCVVGIIPIILLFSGNTAAPLYFLAAGVILAIFSMGYTRMSRFVEGAGGFYSYIQAGLGRVAGGGSATLALGAYVLTLIAIFAYIGVFAAQIVADLAHWEGTPWWAWSLACAAATGLLGFRNIEVSAKALGLLLIAETLVVVVLDVAILMAGGPEGFSARPLALSNATSGAPGLGLMFAFLCFLGFEATTVFRSEARDPEKTIPRATFVAVIGVGVFYSATSLVLIQGLGVDRALAAVTNDPTGVVFALGTTYVGPVFADVMQVLLLTSLFAAALSFHNVVNRYQLSMSRTGLLPRWVGQIHPRNLAPSNASLLVSAISIVVIAVIAVLGLDPITQVYAPLSGCLGFAVLILMVLTSVSVVVHFRRTPQRGPVGSTVIAPVVSLIGLGVIIVLAFMNIDLLSGSQASSIFLIVLLAALLLVGVFARLAQNLRAQRPGYRVS